MILALRVLGMWGCRVCWTAYLGCSVLGVFGLHGDGAGSGAGLAASLSAEFGFWEWDVLAVLEIGVFWNLAFLEIWTFGRNRTSAARPKPKHSHQACVGRTRVKPRGTTAVGTVRPVKHCLSRVRRNAPATPVLYGGEISATVFAVTAQAHSGAAVSHW